MVGDPELKAPTSITCFGVAAVQRDRGVELVHLADDPQIAFSDARPRNRELGEGGRSRRERRYESGGRKERCSGQGGACLRNRTLRPIPVQGLLRQPSPHANRPIRATNSGELGAGAVRCSGPQATRPQSGLSAPPAWRALGLSDAARRNTRRPSGGGASRPAVRRGSCLRPPPQMPRRAILFWYYQPLSGML